MRFAISEIILSFALCCVLLVLSASSVRIVPVWQGELLLSSVMYKLCMYFFTGLVKDAFMWLPLCSKLNVHFKQTKTALDSFFLKALLPILLIGKPQSQSTSDGDVSSSTTSTYCWCHGGESGKMVACDNTRCPIEWFHFNWVGLTRKPRGKWYCSESCKNNII